VIRRIPVLDIGRIEGKALPEALLGICEKICESIGPRPEITYAERRRERCKVEENATPPVVQHGFLRGKGLSKDKGYRIIRSRATGFFCRKAKSVEQRAESIETQIKTPYRILFALRSLL